MAIYRPAKARWPTALAAAIVGLLVGLLVGYLAFGRAEPDPAEALRELDATLTGAAGVLEVAEIEYAESVEDGEVVREPEYQGALDALERSRTRYEEVKGALESVAPDATARLDAAYDELESAMSARAPDDEIADLIDRLTALLENPFGGPT